jgi:hypothetical protein
VTVFAIPDLGLHCPRRRRVAVTRAANSDKSDGRKRDRQSKSDRASKAALRTIVPRLGIDTPKT